MSILIAMLLHLVCTMAHNIKSCSEYNITYGIKTEKYILGLIVIPFPPGNEVHIRVGLNVPTDLPKEKFVLEMSVWSQVYLQAAQRTDVLMYTIAMPWFKNFSSLSAIWLNNQPYCIGTDVLDGNINANMELGHIVYPSNMEPTLQNLQTYYRNSSTYRIINPIFNINDECGVTSYYTDRTNSLIPNGEYTSPGQWPWVVAVFVDKSVDESPANYEYWCPGTILTNQHILTEGDCLWVNHEFRIDVKKMVVLMGQIDFRRFRRDGIGYPRVTGATQYGACYYYSKSSNCDLGMLFLEKPIEFNPIIKPICLWYGSTALEDVMGRTGYVVGWGKVGLGLGHLHTQEQRMVKMTLMNQETCLRSYSSYGTISQRIFCATSLEVGPCSGDSGSGLVFLDTITGRYHLRGILTPFLPYTNRSLPCDKQIYNVYFDLTKYIPWIEQQVS
ncbi:PREDICTED: proclotting enzyme-like, partial [Vollenhovia emeryi]|uniref:proclotting enzyme-like n=1 Tax=Vollenhovia emeryi TaxID=411798 RepID=UPI0005F47FFF